MSQYEIKRWDAIITGNSIKKTPVIYIKPDEKFLKFAEDRKNALICTINDSNTIYDGKEIPCTVSRSDQVPSYRPNYFKKNGYYIISLFVNWHEYPTPGKLGMVSFSGIDNNIIKPLQNTEERPVDVENDNSLSWFNITQAIVLLIIIIVIIIVLFL